MDPRFAGVRCTGTVRARVAPASPPVPVGDPPRGHPREPREPNPSASREDGSSTRTAPWRDHASREDHRPTGNGPTGRQDTRKRSSPVEAGREEAVAPAVVVAFVPRQVGGSPVGTSTHRDRGRGLSRGTPHVRLNLVFHGVRGGFNDARGPPRNKREA